MQIGIKPGIDVEGLVGNLLHESPAFGQPGVVAAGDLANDFQYRGQVRALGIQFAPQQWCVGVQVAGLDRAGHGSTQQIQLQVRQTKLATRRLRRHRGLQGKASVAQLTQPGSQICHSGHPEQHGQVIAAQIDLCRHLRRIALQTIHRHGGIEFCRRCEQAHRRDPQA
ncbi:MAG: hypothetical protein EBZ14_06910, partial [Gammaproteobacteria bacterium]|nr:hypothetical protein [Gammaproteobacteria bacterium]